MKTHRSKESLRFYRAASLRFEEAQFLLHHSDYTTAAVYLAGYAVECALKTLILFSEPAVKNARTVKELFRGEKAHEFEWLKERLVERHVRLPAEIAKELAKANWWSTNLRYEPATIKRSEAERFVSAVENVILWVKGRL